MGAIVSKSTVVAPLVSERVLSTVATEPVEGDVVLIDVLTSFVTVVMDVAVVEVNVVVVVVVTTLDPLSVGKTIVKVVVVVDIGGRVVSTTVVDLKDGDTEGCNVGGPPTQVPPSPLIPPNISTNPPGHSSTQVPRYKNVLFAHTRH